MGKSIDTGICNWVLARVLAYTIYGKSRILERMIGKFKSIIDSEYTHIAKQSYSLKPLTLVLNDQQL